MTSSITAHLNDRPWLFSVVLIGCWIAIGQQAGAVPGRLLSYNTAAVGTETRLTSVTIDDARGTLSVGQLIGIDLVHFRMTTSTSGSSTAVLSPNTAAEIDLNERANLLDTDQALNTGIVNVPSGSGLAVGTTYSATTTGFAINFLQPVANGPGDDFIFFDFGSATNPNADSFIASALVGGLSTGFATIAASSDYLPSQTVLATLTHSQNNPMANLSDLETRALNSSISTQTMLPRAAGGSFDFSNLGVPANALVTGLFLTSASSFDPVFIAGLPPVLVPEPGTALLVLSAGLLALRIRARRQH